MQFKNDINCSFGLPKTVEKVSQQNFKFPNVKIKFYKLPKLLKKWRETIVKLFNRHRIIKTLSHNQGILSENSYLTTSKYVAKKCIKVCLELKGGIGKLFNVSEHLGGFSL